MKNEIAISVQNVGKMFRIWDNPAGRLWAAGWEWLASQAGAGTSLQKALQARAARHYRDFWALRDVSLEIKKGDALGIVGRNGSGKSTLLQIIAGTLRPTTGSVQVNGRVAALLELGSGFNPEFSGRENIYLNAAVLGLSREEIDTCYEDIVAYSEIGDFIEQPIKTYSSGMALRLAFAVAAHVRPDVLIIDEALSVGDARFQLKCARTIDKFVEEGVTILFVSHDPSSVKRLCQHAILLEGGNMIYGGLPNDVINLYSKLLADGGSVQSIQSDIEKLSSKSASEPIHDPAPPPRHDTQSNGPADVGGGASAAIASGPEQELRLQLAALEAVLNTHRDAAELAEKVERLVNDERSRIGISGQEFSYGGSLGKIVHLEICDRENQNRAWFVSGEDVTVRIEVETYEVLQDPIFALTIKNTAGVDVYGTNTLFSRQPSQPMRIGERREVTFSFPMNLMPGNYFLSFGFTQFVGEELLVIHRRYDALKIEVLPADRSFGIANLHAKIAERTLGFLVLK